MAERPPVNRALLARADIALFQCVVTDSNQQKRNVLVYQCGENVFYSSSMDGLFDINRRKPAPKWLKDQIKSPEGYTDIYNARGDRFKSPASGLEGATMRVPNSPDQVVMSANPDQGVVLDEDGVAQG